METDTNHVIYSGGEIRHSFNVLNLKSNTMFSMEFLIWVEVFWELQFLF